MTASASDLATINEQLQDAHPQQVLLWAFDNIAPIAIACSFQFGGLILAYLAREILGGPVPVLFMQTGFHFPETIEFRDKVVKELNLELIETKPTLGPERQAREIHPELYRVDPDQCCHLNKVLPLQAALEELEGWVTGVRRDQGPTRATTSAVERQVLDSGKVIWKVNPLVTWSRQQVEVFAREYGIPRHPLYDRGYRSIGCAPCTRPVSEDEDDRAGRWDGLDKAECGIHTFGTSPAAEVAS